MKSEITLRHLASGNRQPATGIRHLASGNRHQAASIVCLLLFLALTSTSFAQQEMATGIDPHDALFRAQFQTIDFGGNLALRIAGDPVKNYYLVDMTRFHSRFEKIWFLYRIFQEEKVVTLDNDISQDQMWFFSDKMYPEKEVLDLFSGLKKSTDSVSGGMTEEEKLAWLKRNDKYENNPKNEYD